MSFNTSFTDMFQLRIPVIMAPMFLVSNEAMMKSAMQCGIMGTFPTLNYRKENELSALLKTLNLFKKEHNAPGNYGVNLIVQQTNPLYKDHLEICVKEKVPFYITSLGNPKEVIQRAHEYGGKVFCDVTNAEHAEKCASLQCDGFIAVSQGAGGHAGPYPQSVLLPFLRENYPHIPVVAAGGIATGAGILSVLALGAAGASIGTRFIASNEAAVSEAYKNAIVDSGMDDIMMTERISGTPCAIISTPYAKKIGPKQNWFERWMSNNPTTKKYFKMLVQYKGMGKFEKAVKPGNYDNLWAAGQSVELIHDIIPCENIIQRLEAELEEAMFHLMQQHIAPVQADNK
ncbi:MAG: nitronate monooxygenase [Bacteroidetes bacterium]|nr:nitronate monooxygenase [Bacteroidota bacterium]